MYISLNWIRRHCPFETDDSPARIGERFSLATAEVEGVTSRGEGLEQFVAGRVLESEEVNGTGGRLRKCLVDHGAAKPSTVVCGAPNARVGVVAPFARPGLVVLGKELRAAKIRGVVSHGMLLAEDELGLSDNHDEIMELPGDVEPGVPLTEVHPDLRDIVLEIDNKSMTHRPDLWGHHGLAREFATIYGTPLRPYEVDESLATRRGDARVRVSIEDGDARRRCRRYCGLRIDRVKVGPSPAWLRHLLLAVGSRPINNIVDITNYILFDLGQPLHAFDRERIEGEQIIVRMRSPKEKLRLLDGREIALDAEDLVIADGRRAVALAGVMGGEDSEISPETTSIFLESANFDPGSVRRSSMRHGRTESSARFEKSLDATQARLGILRAAELVLELCPGARVVGPLQDVGFEPPDPIVIELSSDFIPGRLGTELSEERTREILDGLGFEVDETQRAAADIGIAPSTWRVTVPSWRATRDVSIREDLVEEVGRIHGYGEIEPFAPKWPVVAPPINERRVLERGIKQFLTLRCGLDEVFTYPMVGAEHCALFGLDPSEHLVLVNAMSEDLDRLRREIVPIHLEKARDNQRFVERFGFFEMGRVYLKEASRLREPELPREQTRVCGVLSVPEKDERNFYRVRRIVLSLARFLQLDGVSIAPLEAAPSWAHPGVGATLRVGDAVAGSFYRVHPVTAGRLELRGDVLAFDLDLETIAAAPRSETRYRPLPRYPGVPFDVAVVADERTAVGAIREVIVEAGKELLRDVSVFDVYRGAGVGEGKKSVAFQLLFRADDHTLGADEVDRIQNAVVEALERAGYPLRS